MELQAYLRSRAALIEKALERYLPRDNRLISRAMKYSLMAGGKRLRPVLVLEGAALCGGRPADYLAPACALEYVHTYSLIHDDLPAMDNDDLRRGKPTSHKKFGEAAAILAGDALLTDAFLLMTLSPAGPAAAIDALRLLAAAAGHDGMIGGQVADTLETDAWQKKGKARSARTLEYIHLNKTAALLRASLTIGATLAGGNKKQTAALDGYGRDIGLAFQIADDILDITADKKLLGKRGSDRDNNKLTWPAIHGLDASREKARALVASAKKHLSLFGPRAKILAALADYIVDRDR